VASGKVTLDDAPTYAACSVEASGHGLAAFGDFEDRVVHVWLPDPQTGALTASVDLATLGSPQVIQIDEDSSGDVFMLVTTCDYDTDVSRVEGFQDTDGDSVPDAASRVTLTSETGAHYFTSILDRSTGTLYLGDGKNDRVLRLSDTDGDRIPDGSSKTTFGTGTSLAGLGETELLIVGLAEPKAASVAVLRSAGALEGATDLRVGQRPRYELTDTDGDGVADAATLLPPPSKLHAELVGLLLGGMTSVQVDLSLAATVRIDIDDGTSPDETLASATLSKGISTLALSRGLAAGEVVKLVIDPTGRVVASTKVGVANATHFDGVKADPWTVHVAGGGITFSGVSVSGSETVRAVLATADDDDDAWKSCTVQSWDADSLTVTIPTSLALTKMTSVMFEITTPAGDQFIVTALVKPQGS